MTKQEFLNTILKLNAESVEVFKDMVNQIEEQAAEQEEMITLSKSTFKNLMLEIVNGICNEGTNLIDDYELSMGYSNCVELDDISFSESKLYDIVESSLESYFDVEDED